MGSSRYDHPNFLIVRERYLNSNVAGISSGSLGEAYLGSTLRTYQKCEVIGVSIVLASGGSAQGTNSLRVQRTGATTDSAFQVLTFQASADASAAGDVVDMSLTSPMTLTSFGDAAMLEAIAASLDKVNVIRSVLWRYRILPFELTDK